MRKTTLLLATLFALIAATGCATAGTLSFTVTCSGFDNAAICPASADTIQASNPVDALVTWQGPKAGADSLLQVPRNVPQLFKELGLPAGAYTVTIVWRDAGGMSCGDSKVFIVKGPPAKKAF